LKIASWAPRSPENQESFGNRLPSIFKAINEVRMAIGENFTSADLDIIVFECDRIYDPAGMDDPDAYGDGRQSRGKRAPEPTVGTTGIGLTVMAERNAKDVLQFQFKSLPVIPAKFVLTSTLNEALEAIQSTTFKEDKQIENMDGANLDGRD
jgi:hypothetical protein